MVKSKNEKRQGAGGYAQYTQATYQNCSRRGFVCLQAMYLTPRFDSRRRYRDGHMENKRPNISNKPLHAMTVA